MKNIIKNKIGDEKYFSLWWFLVISIVAIGIIAGVFIFYSSPIDARDVESKIMYDKISNCLVRGGFLENDVLNSNFDIFEKCGLKKEIFSGETSFYFNLGFVSDGKKIRGDITQGDFSYGKDCEITQSIEADKFPVCFNNIQPFLYYENGDIKKGTLEVLTASNQEGRKIPSVGK
ncbi:MAG: hypothetical protein AABW63_02650 [Nanoarchaeota archaeon]